MHHVMCSIVELYEEAMKMMSGRIGSREIDR